MTAPTTIDTQREQMRARMMSRLAVRWPKANSYLTAAGARVQCAHPLPAPECDLFETYALAYQDAIQDMMVLIHGSAADPGVPYALRQAEESPFQGGSLPPMRGTRAGREPSKRSRNARKRAEALFRSEGNGDAV